VDYILDGLPSAADQAWAQEVRRSRRRVPCPRCGGTGLGWEARIRQIEGASLLAIRQRFSLSDLERWFGGLDCRSAEGRAAVQRLRERFAQLRGLGLEQLPCGLPVSEASLRERLLARAACAGQHALVGAVAVLDPGEGDEDLSGVAARLGEQGGMIWPRAGEA
jgi:excinuclease UvrABC ATPase subunit